LRRVSFPLSNSPPQARPFQKWGFVILLRR
jgi:hypothetical protein